MKSWRGRSGLAKVDLYTRVTAYMLLWASVFVLALLLLIRPVRHEAPPLLVAVAPLLNLANGILCHRFLRRAMDTYLKPGTVFPPREVLPAAAVTAATTGAVLLEAATADLTGLLPGMLGAALVPFLAGHCLIHSIRAVALHQALLMGVLAALVPLTGRSAGETLASVLTVAFLTGWLAVTVRLSLWVLGVVFELREARDVQARLAVAEERLRFGRDLHDILGRNLSVIALKSELAVQLARRERPEAVDQMIEVQRIAQESQREVRDVVRGYREADLRVELEGARGCSAPPGSTAPSNPRGSTCPTRSRRRSDGWSARPRRTYCDTGTRGAAPSPCGRRRTGCCSRWRTTAYGRTGAVYEETGGYGRTEAAAGPAPAPGSWGCGSGSRRSAEPSRRARGTTARSG